MAELTAVLDARIAPLVRAFAEATAATRAMKAELDSLEARTAALELSHAKFASTLRGGARDLDNWRSVLRQGVSDARDARLETDNLSTIFRKAGNDAREAERGTAAFNRELERLKRNNAGGGAGGGALAGILPGGARAGPGAIGALAATAGPAIAPLIPSIGALATVPALLGTIGAEALVAREAFKGMGAAIGGNKKAYDGLNESQKSFVDTIRNGVYPLLNGLKQIVTTNTFAPITAAIREVVANKEALANIGGIARELAQGVGQLAASWIKFLGSAQVTREIGQFFAAWIPIVQEFMPIIQSLFQSFLQFETAIAPLGQFLADAFAKGAAAIKDWVSNGKNATDFVTSVEQSLRLLWATVETLANVFRSLYDVLAPIGRVILPDILKGLNFVADGLRHNAKLIGTDYVGAWKAVVDIVKVLAPLIGPMFRAWFEAIGIVVKQVDAVASHLKFLEPVVQFLSGVFDRFGKYIFLALSGPTSLLIVAWQKWGKDIKAIFTDVGNGFVWMLNNLILKPWEQTINGIISALNVLPFVNIGKVNYQVPTIGGPGNTAAFSGAPSAGGVGLHSGPGGSALAAAAGAAVSAGLGQTGATRAQIKSSPGPGLGYSGAFGGTYRQQGRTDQGVDFSGAGAITAIGNGIVMRCERGNSGWPNGDPKGAFLSIYLTEGSRQGWTYFIAEYFTIAPGLTGGGPRGGGSKVRAGQVIGHQYGGIEMGWVSSPSQGSAMSGNALTSQLGQQGKGSDPGNVSYQGQPGSMQGQDFAAFLSTGGGFSPLTIPQIGGAPAFTGGPRARKPRVPPALQQLLGLGGETQLASAQNAVAAAQAKAASDGSVANIGAEVEAESKLIKVIIEERNRLEKLHETGKLEVARLKELKTLNDELGAAYKKRGAEEKAAENAARESKEMTQLRGLGPLPGTGGAGAQSLQREYNQIKQLIATNGVAVNAQMAQQLAVLDNIIGEGFGPKSHAKEKVRAYLDAIRQVITDRVAAIKSALSGVSSALQSMESTALSAFDAINSNWQSPAAKQLAAMQAQDQAQQLAQALKDAIDQYGAGSQQAKDAQRAIDEAQLAQQAADQQTAHDQALKAQKDQFEKEYAGLEKQIQRQHLTAEEAAKRLRALYKKYGLTPDSVQAATDWNTAQSLFVQGMSDLVNALNNLYTAITGKAPPGSGAGGSAGGAGAPGFAPGVVPPSGANPFTGVQAPPGTNPFFHGGDPNWGLHPFGYATGGTISSMYGSGAVPIVAHEGEFVINARSAANIGLGNLYALNAYAFGGPVLPKNPGSKINPNTGTPDDPAYRAAAMWINDYGVDRNVTSVGTALAGLIGPRAQAQAAIRHTTVPGFGELRQGSWRAPMPDDKLLTLLTSAYPGIVFEGGTPGQQISAQQAVSRIPGGWGSVAGLIQSSMGLTGAASPVERATSHAIHFGSGYMTDALARANADPHNQRLNPSFTPAFQRGGPIGSIPVGGSRQVAEFHIYIDGDQVEKVVTSRQVRNGRYGRPGIMPPTI